MTDEKTTEQEREEFSRAYARFVSLMRNHKGVNANPGVLESRMRLRGQDEQVEVWSKGNHKFLLKGRLDQAGAFDVCLFVMTSKELTTLKDVADTTAVSDYVKRAILQAL